MAAGSARANETWATDKQTGAKIFWVSNSGSLLTSVNWDGPAINGLAQGTGSFTITIRLNGKDFEAKGQGEMLAGYLDGKVTLQWNDGDSFNGFYRKGRVNGEGSYSWANGNRYDGEWVDGIIAGKGIFTWSDGKSYEGEWQKGKRNGQGVMKDPQGKILYDGQWKDDSPVVIGLKTDTVLGIPWGASEKTVKNIMSKRPDTKFWKKGNRNEALQLTYFTTYNGISVFCHIFIYQDQMYWVQVVAQTKTDEETLKQYGTFKQGLMDRYGLAINENGKGMEALTVWDLGEGHLLSIKMGKFAFIQNNPFPTVFINYWYKPTDDLVEKPVKEKNTADY